MQPESYIVNPTRIPDTDLPPTEVIPVSATVRETHAMLDHCLELADRIPDRPVRERPTLSIEADLHQIEPLVRADTDKNGTPREYKVERWVYTIRRVGDSAVYDTTPPRGSQGAASTELKAWLLRNNAVRVGDPKELLTAPKPAESHELDRAIIAETLRQAGNYFATAALSGEEREEIAAALDAFHTPALVAIRARLRTMPVALERTLAANCGDAIAALGRI